MNQLSLSFRLPSENTHTHTVGGVSILNWHNMWLNCLPPSLFHICTYFDETTILLPSKCNGITKPTQYLQTCAVFSLISATFLHAAHNRVSSQIECKLSQHIRANIFVIYLRRSTYRIALDHKRFLHQLNRCLVRIIVDLFTFPCLLIRMANAHERCARSFEASI